jgi:hypothetical protein
MVFCDAAVIENRPSGSIELPEAAPVEFEDSARAVMTNN